MDCEICGKKEPESIMVLPIHKSDGALITIVCEDCGEKSSAYCVKHRRIHQGFDDGTTVCIACVEELIAQERHNARHVADAVMKHLSLEEAADLREVAEMSSSVTGDPTEVSILRFVASKAKRTKTSVEMVIDIIVSSGSAECILP